ncbi:formamidopyrimidine-DNA glycosylase [Pedobacter frigiditerrae]|uniref:Formamidopyrimidine-DNA glycosylase n=1 Tax=Pedobacter frigiditerrae TaxID=2530452 RepID=A0A4R0MQ00_9SPHI|nr:DNA-formamidopyrimidine glycosylase family protein [Pedobacter frigiditerrae]TCC88074.1 formamidopyrimidine-DNA glycosylase [Pedobacter frigiditerrae]
MAELPDLTVFAGILNRRFKGKTLKELDVVVANKINASEKELKKALEGKKLLSVSREGKTLQMHFSDDQVLGLHLMLRGELVLLDQENTNPKYQILGFHFTGGEGFALVDLQKQATPTLNPAISKVPDALVMDLDYFSSLLAKKRTTIKTLLMDQHWIRGIGNSYGDEILWDASISPFSIANAIPEAAVKTLYKSLTVVLKKAIKAIEKENGDELKGELRDFMQVHGAGLKKSPTGAAIKSETIGGRKSYYTEEQHLYI